LKPVKSLGGLFGSLFWENSQHSACIRDLRPPPRAAARASEIFREAGFLGIGAVFYQRPD
jgi:hypothetical protein